MASLLSGGSGANSIEPTTYRKGRGWPSSSRLGRPKKKKGGPVGSRSGHTCHRYHQTWLPALRHIVQYPTCNPLFSTPRPADARPAVADEPLGGDMAMTHFPTGTSTALALQHNLARSSTLFDNRAHRNTVCLILLRVVSERRESCRPGGRPVILPRDVVIGGSRRVALQMGAGASWRRAGGHVENLRPNLPRRTCALYHCPERETDAAGHFLHGSGLTGRAPFQMLPAAVVRSLRPLCARC